MKQILLRFIIFFILLVNIFSCQEKRDIKVQRGFYYWKSKFELNQEDRKLFNTLKTKKIYLKFFDVDFKEEAEEPIPQAIMQPEGELDSLFEIIPTVFITNRTFDKLGEHQVHDLASKIYKKIKLLSHSFVSPVKLHEVQIDCDWNISTREKYFTFLKVLKDQFGAAVKISATIRLHQVKYFEKTGVPPVDRGMLMFYNMGDVNNLETDNSIFNVKEASKYLTRFDEYPLELDVALSVFSWAAVYREDKLIQLISGFEPSLLNNQHLEEIKPGLFRANKSIEMRTFVARAGDLVKFEIVKPENTLEAASLIRSYLKDSVSVVLFDYNHLNLKRYDAEDFENIFNTFN